VLAGEMVAIFLKECPALVQAVRDAMRRESAEQMRDAAHALKSAIGHFSTDGATATASHIEQLAREGGSITAAMALLPALERQVDALLASLAAYRHEHESCVS
jgi:HPt (histidine-containing phosphotransfer) domain-containing protein